jgi:hypothetical protein
MKSKEEKEMENEFRFKVRENHKLIGKGGTWSDTLNQLGIFKFGKHKWCGVYHQNNMPWSKIKKSKCLYGILNNDYKGEGEHWLAFYVKDKQFYCFDTFGRSMKEIVPLLEKKLKGQRIRYKFSDRDANQKDSQEDCGARCIAWLECIKEFGIRKSMKI